MGRLFTRLALLLVLMLLIFAGVMLFPQDESGYVFSDIEKLERLKTLASPKMILVGGSNVAMGIDSEMLEKEYAMPVVNTGLHAGLGIRFLFERVRSHVHKGDIVIISPEYENFFDEFYNGFGPILAGTIGSLPAHVQYVSSREQLIMLITSINNLPNARIYNFLLYVIKTMNMGGLISEDTSVYSRGAFNCRGDLVSHLVMQSPGLTYGALPDFSIRKSNNDIYIYLQEMNEHIVKNGGALYFSFPLFAQSAFMKNKDSIDAIHWNLRHNTNIIIIDTPDDKKNMDMLFFDNYYHLNAEGRKLRTQGLIQSLCKRIKK